MVEICADIIKKLEDQINKRKKVIIFEHEDVELLYLITANMRNVNSPGVKIWTSIDDVVIDADLERISLKDMDEVLTLYRMYDFSDRITVISDSDQYGNLFNYLRNGILSKEEMVDAILFDHGKETLR